jgi:hypothetical protein
MQENYFPTQYSFPLIWKSQTDPDFLKIFSKRVWAVNSGPLSSPSVNQTAHEAQCLIEAPKTLNFHEVWAIKGWPCGSMGLSHNNIAIVSDTNIATVL